MFLRLDVNAKQIFFGNVLFIICCAFYIAWWLLAFKPSGAITGMKSGWLLIPAAVTGVWGVVQALRGVLEARQVNRLFPGSAILWGGVAFYIVLSVITVWIFKRPMTSELFLIVGWGMFALAEINALFGYGLFSYKQSVGFILVACTAIFISLVCYILYYRLDKRGGFIDGMIPLLLAALTTAGVSCFMIFP